MGVCLMCAMALARWVGVGVTSGSGKHRKIGPVPF